MILDLLADGSVNLTAVRLLAPHLTAENHQAVLAEAKGMTRRQVEKLVARLAPQPDVPPSIRKLPASGPSVRAAEPVAATPSAREEEEGSRAAPSAKETIAVRPTTEKPTTVTTPPPAMHRLVVAPLSPERYRVQFTVGKDA